MRSLLPVSPSLETRRKGLNLRWRSDGSNRFPIEAEIVASLSPEKT